MSSFVFAVKEGRRRRRMKLGDFLVRSSKKRKFGLLTGLTDVGTGANFVINFSC
jgi:hypothetical protein